MIPPVQTYDLSTPTASRAHENNIETTATRKNSNVTNRPISNNTGLARPKCSSDEQIMPSPTNTTGGNLENLQVLITNLLQLINTIISALSSGKMNTASASTITGDKAVKTKRSASISNGEDFLWKPKSDKDQKVAVLLPASLQDKVEEVSILSPDGNTVLDTGALSGVGNGDREHYRFSKAGNEFPAGSHVLIALKDGTSQIITINDTALRQEG